MVVAGTLRRWRWPLIGVAVIALAFIAAWGWRAWRLHQAIAAFDAAIADEVPGGVRNAWRQWIADLPPVDEARHAATAAFMQAIEMRASLAALEQQLQTWRQQGQEDRIEAEVLAHQDLLAAWDALPPGRLEFGINAALRQRIAAAASAIDVPDIVPTSHLLATRHIILLHAARMWLTGDPQPLIDATVRTTDGLLAQGSLLGVVVAGGNQQALCSWLVAAAEGNRLAEPLTELPGIGRDTYVRVWICERRLWLSAYTADLVVGREADWLPMGPAPTPALTDWRGWLGMFEGTDRVALIAAQQRNWQSLRTLEAYARGASPWSAVASLAQQSEYWTFAGTMAGVDADGLNRRRTLAALHLLCVAHAGTPLPEHHAAASAVVGRWLAAADGLPALLYERLDAMRFRLAPDPSAPLPEPLTLVPKQQQEVTYAVRFR